MDAIHGEDFCSIHHAGGTIRGRCIDLYFDPEFIPLAFVQVKKIKPNLNEKKETLLMKNKINLD